MQVLAALLALRFLALDDTRLNRDASAAATAMKSGAYATAEHNYRSVLRLRPKMAEAHVNLGLSLFLQRKYPEAIKSFDRGLQLQPDLANARLFTGISYFKINRPKEALPVLLSYTSERPKDWEGYYYLGLSYLAMRSYEESEKALLSARVLNPREIDVIYHLTQVYLGQAGDHPEQRELLAAKYKEAVQAIDGIDPESYRLAQLRAGFYEVEGKKAEAIRELEVLLRSTPNSRGLHYTLGCLYTEAREYSSALAQFQAELKLDSPYPRTYLQLGHVYLALERADEALPLLKKALEMEPEGSGLAWVEIGRAYRLKNEAIQAVKAFETAIAFGQRKASVYYQLALAEKKAGNPSQSREALETSQRLRHEEETPMPASLQQP